MKRFTILLSLFALLGSAMPVFAADTLTDCGKARTTTTRCLEQTSGNLTRYRLQNSSAVQDARLLRRSDSSSTAVSRTVQSKIRKAEIERRDARLKKTINSKEDRITDARARAKLREESRLQQLRIRISTLQSRTVLQQNSLRIRSEQIDQSSQIRRNLLRKIRTLCDNKTGAERLKCMSDARKELQ
jgi:hypothetical protein